MLLGDTVYVASSGGLVQGWDFSSVRTGIGEPTRTFRFWTGDDTDARSSATTKVSSTSGSRSTGTRPAPASWVSS